MFDQLSTTSVTLYIGFYGNKISKENCIIFIAGTKRVYLFIQYHMRNRVTA